MSEFHYGGQAVLEGVMMRGERHMAVAVRNPEGEIVVHEEALSPIYTNRWAELPFVRGLIMLWDTLNLGYRALTFSANVAMPEEEEELGSGAMVGSVLLSLVFVVAIFFLLPTFLVGLVDPYIPPAASSAVEGVIRITLFVLYLVAISYLPDIRRVFAYHGAEHKTVNAYEADVPLKPDRVQAFSSAHTRCGTSFLLVILVLYVLITILIGRHGIWFRLLSRLVLIPVVAGISYELLKLSAKYSDHPVVKVLMAPGLALQRLSTREPDDDMVEVAIVALKRVLRLDDHLEQDGENMGDISDGEKPDRLADD